MSFLEFLLGVTFRGGGEGAGYFSAVFVLFAAGCSAGSRVETIELVSEVRTQ